MEKNLAQRINEVCKDPEMLEKLNGCKSIEEVYASCTDRLPDVTFEEFKEIVSIEDASILDEKDLEVVAGGVAKPETTIGITGTIKF